MKHGPAANLTHLLLFLRSTSERFLVLYGHFHPKLLTATEVVRFLVFILFLVKGSVGSVFVRHANVNCLGGER